jgi:hypothetical protein
MLDAIVATLKGGAQLKGGVAILQHLESLSVNCLDVFCEGAGTRNDCIDALCAVLQAMKVPVTPSESE